MKYLVFCVSILFTSCTANWHLKKSQRQFEKAMQKDPKIRADANVVYVKDTVIVEEFKRDTLMQLVHDTLRFETTKFRTEVVFRESDTVWIETICYADTIVREVEKIVYAPTIDTRKWHEKFTQKMGNMFFIIIIIALIVLGFLKFRR